MENYAYTNTKGLDPQSSCQENNRYQHSDPPSPVFIISGSVLSRQNVFRRLAGSQDLACRRRAP